jgi:uncharacterized damage-inducible protein DinB
MIIQMKFITSTIVFLSAATLLVGAEASNPMMDSSKAFYSQIKNNIQRSLEKMPEEQYAFKPSPDVRSFGQLVAHVADAQYILCGIVADGKPTMKTNEKTAKTKAELSAALKDGFAFCDAQYEKLTDADAVTAVNWFGQKRTKLSVLDFNIAHAFEHYGNMVTYMRMKGLVPPSSEKQ